MPAGSTTAATPKLGDRSVRKDSAVEYHRERRYDLTGDGAPDMLTLSASGSHWDSLTVVLRITSVDGALLYRDQWNSAAYFEYLVERERSTAAVEREVRQQLDWVFSDNAFIPAARVMENPDLRETLEESMRFHLAAHEWRQNRGMRDSLPLPRRAFDEISATQVHDSVLAQIADDVRGQPAFRYFSGGKITTAIAWSPALGRFVTIFSCC